jgi:hypothetical protein
MRSFLRENSLSLFFAAIFLLTLVAQSFAGQHAVNAEQVAHGEPPYGWWRYVTSSDFGGAVMENWQSEFLQFTLFILATSWLVQTGSNESKPLQDAGLEFTIYLRQRGSPESKPVGAPRDETGTSG